jgi:hypothetical protein
MGVKIFSIGAGFIISNNQSVYSQEKTHIRRISIIRDDTIKIETGNDPLKSIYIPFKEVTDPVFETIEQLQEWLFQQLPATGSGGGITGFAKEETQLLVLAELRKIAGLADDIKTLVLKNTPNSGMGNPDRIDDTPPFTVYRGWTNSTEGNTGNPVWAIQKTFSDKGFTEITWADGNHLFDNQWDDRYNLNYF